MIISYIIGGLGNQMFQYAAGRALSQERDVPLLLDTSDFGRYGKHQGFELTRVFSCPVTLAQPKDIHAILGWQSSSRIRHFAVRPFLEFLRKRHLIAEPYFHYWPNIRDVSLPCYLMGYWQSERYFSNVPQTIRADFTFKQPLTDRNLDFAQKIIAVNSVSLHIRRGDYASNAKALAWHGMCPLSYYEAAIKFMAERLDNPHFFVFSDDMGWVRKNLNIAYQCHYVNHNFDAESFNDMHLMSLCKHHIIANSSFSWWGAWLNPSTTKIVLAPKRWFNEYQADTKDLLPNGWLSL